eukprot:GFUD01030037.1.p1 GENE.GFUD01030037.1~~GFUD01030037.1.p1  ORF type:complete len:350 (-),score=122.62 GFUD01030037.1:1-1050(-)
MMASTSTCPQVMSTSTSTLVIIERVEDYGKAKNATLPRKRGRGNIVAELPPLPMESELFTPPVDKGDRREKSIKVLGEKLLAMMPNEGTLEVEVDKMARELKADIKRVYNICNVLEGLRLMERQGRNVWKWQGREGLPTTLLLLKQMSEQQNMKGQMDMARKVLAKKLIVNFIGNKADAKHNLVMMTQKLMMMFLILPQTRTLSLSIASIIIHGPGLSGNKMRTSLQRLGDISRVLQSMGLLAEVRVKKEGGSKGTISYQYVGLEVPTVFVMNVWSQDVEMEEEIAAVSSIIVEDGREMVERTEKVAVSAGDEGEPGCGDSRKKGDLLQVLPSDRVKVMEGEGEKMLDF